MHLCQLFGLSRQAYYQAKTRDEKRYEQWQRIESIVLDIRRKLPRLGTRKLYHLIKDTLESLDIKIGRDGLFSCLRSLGLLVKPTKSYIKTTYSKHWMKKHPNLYVEPNLTQPEQVFVSDITYVESEQGIHYLSLVTDAYSRKIVGHKLSHDMKAGNMVQAFEQSVKGKDYKNQLIHHSDRGSQYCSERYQSSLRKHGVRPSMTDGYDCYQNALAERVNGILKQEFLLYKCKTFNELKILIDESVRLYNEYRPHLSLGMKTPEEVHKKGQLLT